MNLGALDELMAELKEERATAERELEAARDRQGRIEALENERKIVLAFYAGFASADLNGFPPEERRRLYRALGPKATVDKDGWPEVTGAGGNYFPDPEEGYKLIERINPDIKRDEAYQEVVAHIDTKLRRAGLEHMSPEDRRSVMSCDGSS